VFALQVVTWAGFGTAEDTYCTQNRWVLGLRDYVDLATQLPVRGAVLLPSDNYSFALTSGLPTISLLPSEWKQMSAPRYIASGGAGIAIYEVGAQINERNLLSLAELQQTWPQVTCTSRSFRGREFRICAVNTTDDVLGSAVPDEPFGRASLGRVHPRWLSLTPAARTPLWEDAFGGDPTGAGPTRHGPEFHSTQSVGRSLPTGTPRSLANRVAHQCRPHSSGRNIDGIR
jgi:hypothetical protein